MNSNVVSIDIAKNVFQVCAINKQRKVIFNKKVTRAKLLHTVRQLEPTYIVMEACYSSNYWGRELTKLGAEVKLIPPHQVKPFVQGNKTDHNDAVAIAEASLRPKATFVPIKSLAQQDIQSLHRIRERLQKSRTSMANQLRGLLAEYGCIVKRSVAALRKEVPYLLEDAQNNLTVTARAFVAELYQELLQYDQRIKQHEQTLCALLEPNEDYQRLLSVPGIGPITGAATIAAVGNAAHFKNGRQMAAWLGLTPKLHSSGDNARMGGITKRGNRCLRKLFIHGARAVVNWCSKKTDKLSLWVQRLLKTKHPCKVVVALANKLARIAWAVLSKQCGYDVNLLAA